MPNLFTSPDAWHGGYYELALELHDPTSRTRRAALEALWAHPSLEGCYTSNGSAPASQRRWQPAMLTPRDLDGSLYGLATVGGHPPLPCHAIALPSVEGPAWLSVGIPLAALATVLPVGDWPYDEGSPPEWREELDAWLRSLARAVWSRTGFRLGLIGWIPDGVSAAAVALEGVPADRATGYLVPTARGRLAWHPPTGGAPLPRRRRANLASR